MNAAHTQTLNEERKLTHLQLMKNRKVKNVRYAKKTLLIFSFFLSRNVEESHYHASICCPLRINYKWLSGNKLGKIYGRPTTSHFQIPVWIRINLAPCGEETLSFNQTFYLLIKLWLSSKQILANLVLCKCLNELIKNRRFLQGLLVFSWVTLSKNWLKLHPRAHRRRYSRFGRPENVSREYNVTLRRL